MNGRTELAGGIRVLVGVVAVGFSLLYLLSDVIEFAAGGFSTGQLALTYAAEAAVPFMVIGLYAVQRPLIGWLGLISAVSYAYVFVFFTSTVVVALLEHVPDLPAVQDRFGTWFTVHGVLMVLAGIGFGLAVYRAGVLPRWAGLGLIMGMALIAVTSTLPPVTQLASAAVRDLAFAAMGAALLVPSRRAERPSRQPTAQAERGASPP
jgi:hypothetical protein